jgi:hypothetical protein
MRIAGESANRRGEDGPGPEWRLRVLPDDDSGTAREESYVSCCVFLLVVG